MTDFPNDFAAPPFLSTYSRYGPIWELRGQAGGIPALNASWGTANQARYYPISLPFPYLVRRAFWVNGIASVNVDFGIYTFEGKRLYSTGSTATGGSFAPQFVTLGTPLWLPPGDYYFGFNCDGTTAAVWGTTTAGNLKRFAGIMEEAVGAVTLPDPATFAVASAAGVNLCGVTWTESGF